MDYKLIEPNLKNINRYYDLYDQEQNNEKKWIVPLFQGMPDIDIREYIPEDDFKKWYYDDQEICKLVHNQQLDSFLKTVNAKYRTRLNTQAIAKDLVEWDNLIGLTVDQFVEQCYKSTGKRAYSFATKVFSFIDGNKFPIIDSYVATLLEYYLKKNKRSWNTYENYLNAYSTFRSNNNLIELSYKKIDVFLWTYGKAIQKYWEMNGVLMFESVQYKK